MYNVTKTKIHTLCVYDLVKPKNECGSMLEPASIRTQLYATCTLDTLGVAALSGRNKLVLYIWVV